MKACWRAISTTMTASASETPVRSTSICSIRATSSAVIAMSALAARLTTYAAPASRRARSGGSASSWPTILRTVAVSPAGVGAAGAGGGARGARRGRGIASAEEAVQEGHGRGSVVVDRGSRRSGASAGPGISVVTGRVPSAAGSRPSWLGGPGEGTWCDVGAAGVRAVARPSTPSASRGAPMTAASRSASGHHSNESVICEAGIVTSRSGRTKRGSTSSRIASISSRKASLVLRMPSARSAMSGRQAHDEVIRRSPRTDERLGREPVGASARTQVVGEVVDDAAVGDEDLGLGGQLQLLADLADEHPQLGLAGGRSR